MSSPTFIEYILYRKRFKRLNVDMCRRLLCNMSTSEIIELGLEDRPLLDGCGDVLYKELCLRLTNERKFKLNNV